MPNAQPPPKSEVRLSYYIFDDTSQTLAPTPPISAAPIQRKASIPSAHVPIHPVVEEPIPPEVHVPSVHLPPNPSKPTVAHMSALNHIVEDSFVPPPSLTPSSTGNFGGSRLNELEAEVAELRRKLERAETKLVCFFFFSFLTIISRRNMRKVSDHWLAKQNLRINLRRHIVI